LRNYSTVNMHLDGRLFDFCSGGRLFDVDNPPRPLSTADVITWCVPRTTTSSVLNSCFPAQGVVYNLGMFAMVQGQVLCGPCADPRCDHCAAPSCMLRPGTLRAARPRDSLFPARWLECQYSLFGSRHDITSRQPRWERATSPWSSTT
jgi:hypothetical protein